MERLAKHKINLYSSFPSLRGFANLRCFIEFCIFKTISAFKGLSYFFTNKLEYNPKEISKKDLPIIL
ncbi:unnamed protein product [Commensalibacter papalotli (ex Botero et al. 2024)]|uniref:Transposase n=1 Tax=Commensalibacter papalotli (ex Botero et al. 2024) TaxID=2972766 RepID=A0ABM9HR12_9PROT|nr:unnamed protein product [Commensalibacter papalotli (ex Botero et al. 2024)]